MEAINYANGANMTLPEDSQIVQGISGNAVYLPAGAGTMPIAGNRNELTISLWRQWDGVVEADHYRGVFSTANIKAYFDQATDFLTIELAEVKTVTDIKDDQEQAHWCFLFSKNSFFKIYKNAELKAELTTGNYPVDFSEGFTLGGGRTHATFDEVRMYKSVVTEPEIRGLYRLVTKGTQVQQLENIVTEAAPKYLGVVETVPDTKTVIITKGEKFGFVDANTGDWVLSCKTIGGWKVGVCYKWSGLAWKPLEPAINYAKEYHSCLVHLFEIEELKQQTGHFGALFAKVLVAQKAMIDELLVNQAFIKNLVVRKLRIDTIEGDEHNDFEAWFDELNGLKIRNKGEEIFRVDTNGDVFAKNATMIDGYFSGELNTPTLKLLKKTPETIPFSFTSGQTARDMFNAIGKRNNSSATGSFKGRQIVKISSGEKIKIITDWRSFNRYAGIWEYLKCEEDYFYVHIITDNGVFEYGTFKYGSKYKRPQGYLNPDYAGGAPEYCGSLSINKLDENISFYFTGNFETFKLSNLPTTLPNEVGIVWVDTQGYLRLKL
ncbi:LamG domain-containing protein [Treponema denticola]|uniref:LamG domain-containing protein n=1 Tax=Treponema denticola TaxID=158 RepID=UPI0020A3EB06|nr:LamG domain-containing protein [Treponema denticola]UTC82740.1 LamG domain-containing protein [Treponema denticola]